MHTSQDLGIPRPISFAGILSESGFCFLPELCLSVLIDSFSVEFLFNLGGGKNRTGCSSPISFLDRYTPVIHPCGFSNRDRNEGWVSIDFLSFRPEINPPSVLRSAASTRRKWARTDIPVRGISGVLHRNPETVETRICTHIEKYLFRISMIAKQWVGAALVFTEVKKPAREMIASPNK